jgi:hypothetical protein
LKGGDLLSWSNSLDKFFIVDEPLAVLVRETELLSNKIVLVFRMHWQVVVKHDLLENCDRQKPIFTHVLVSFVELSLQTINHTFRGLPNTF